MWTFNHWEALCRYVRDEVLIAYVIAHHEGAAFAWWPRQDGDPPASH